MDRVYIEERLAEFSLCIVSKPSGEEIKELKDQFDVTDLGNGQIQIKYK